MGREAGRGHVQAKSDRRIRDGSMSIRQAVRHKITVTTTVTLIDLLLSFTDTSSLPQRPHL